MIKFKNLLFIPNILYNKYPPITLISKHTTSIAYAIKVVIKDIPILLLYKIEITIELIIHKIIILQNELIKNFIYVHTPVNIKFIHIKTIFLCIFIFLIFNILQ